jgi:hypothetical protein
MNTTVVGYRVFAMMRARKMVKAFQGITCIRTEAHESRGNRKPIYRYPSLRVQLPARHMIASEPKHYFGFDPKSIAGGCGLALGRIGHGVGPTCCPPLVACC